jgi:hypothetical protein
MVYTGEAASLSSSAVEASQAHEAESHRLSLLALSDQLLAEVEQLRLAESRTLPPDLVEAIAGLQERLGRTRPPVAPATVAAAQNLVFAVQHRLMAANPRNETPLPHPGRASGQPAFATRGGARWKFLTLPPLPQAGSSQQWLELVEGTVDRARDRWSYAQHHALRATRERHAPSLALARCRAAWANYWELLTEAERLTALSGTARGRPAGRRS